MEKFKRHGDGESSEWPERKKRKQKKSSVIKIAKIKGEEQVNHVGKLVNKTQTGKNCRKLIMPFSIIKVLQSDPFFFSWAGFGIVYYWFGLEIGLINFWIGLEMEKLDLSWF
ncbi:hypothetical protein FQA39_LY11064 [Lamprigera yunnana]|nr:hypothetical protein FQA39_LY11064 [Lamprigera yunnana]